MLEDSYSISSPFSCDDSPIGSVLSPRIPHQEWASVSHRCHLLNCIHFLDLLLCPASFTHPFPNKLLSLQFFITQNIPPEASNLSPTFCLCLLRSTCSAQVPWTTFYAPGKGNFWSLSPFRSLCRYNCYFPVAECDQISLLFSSS
jgi:hypothetical protein